MLENLHVNTAIIGGGPAGLSAAIHSIARGRSVCVLSNADTVLGKAEYVENYLGLPHISGVDMMRRFTDHALSLGIIPQKGLVANILPYGGRFMLNVGVDGRKTVIVESDTVILATGAVRAKPVEGETEFLGRGVSYCATCDGMLYRQKRVVVCGNASDIIDETLFLHNIGVNVIFMGKGERPAALSGIEYVKGSLRKISGDGRVTAAVTDNGVTIDTDAVFILRDFIMPAALMDGLTMEDGFIKVNRRMETGIPGVFAAGDCTGAPLQIACAVGEGLIAAQHAAVYTGIKTQ